MALKRLPVRFIIGMALTLLSFACYASAQQYSSVSQSMPRVSSFALMNNTLVYDGKDVILFGEVVGVILRQGNHSWASIYDGTYALGVYAPSVFFNDSLILGDYHHNGDMVEIVGVFNRACNEHGGDADIHAKSVRTVARGHIVERPVSVPKVLFTLLMVVANIPLLMVLRSQNAA